MSNFSKTFIDSDKSELILDFIYTRDSLIKRLLSRFGRKLNNEVRDKISEEIYSFLTTEISNFIRKYTPIKLGLLTNLLVDEIESRLVEFRVKCDEIFLYKTCIEYIKLWERVSKLNLTSKVFIRMGGAIYGTVLHPTTPTFIREFVPKIVVNSEIYTSKNIKF